MGLLPHLNGLYEPADVDAAHDAWGASCGPAALAAVLHRPVMRVYEALQRPTKQKTWVNLTQMRGALDHLGFWHIQTPILAAAQRRLPLDDAAVERRLRAFPRYGLALIQLAGPWEAPGKPIAAAYRHTHWVGVSGGDGQSDYREEILLYDANAGAPVGPSGGWLPLNAWRALVLPHLADRAGAASGRFWIRAGIELPAHGGRGASADEMLAAARLLAQYEIDPDKRPSNS